MLWTTTKRILRSGFVSFWRNSFVSLSAILVTTITLFVVGSLIFLNAILAASLTQIQEKVAISVYFVTTAAEDDILSLRVALEGLPEVTGAEYISRDEALARFEERHSGDELTLQALEELGENPLGASLEIRAVETSEYERIATYLQTTDNASIIDKINYFQNKVAIDRLTNVITSSERFSLIVALVLVLTSVLITFNTIRLAIYTAREEIAVMRLVGASNTYIQGPFIFEGITYGVVSGLITLAFLYPLTLWLGPATADFFGGINVFHYYVIHFGELFAIIMGSGILLGALSSFLAVKKYLKV